MIDKTISHYKILDKLGAGGMGVVYKAEDTKLKRHVALKFLPPAFAADPTTKERFIHEAQSASALQHPAICTIHEINETDDGQLYIVMDYYGGETLQKKIKDKRLKIKEAIEYTAQIARGLQKAHEKGIIHRDIKPANVIITHDKEVKILDFGLAKFTGQTKITKTGSTLGTVAYMSPEQAKGDDVDHRTDIWSLGMMLYEMITGEPAFKGDYEQAVVYSILNENPEAISALRANVPIELERIVNKTLTKNPDERYQHVADLIDDLRSLLKGLEAGTTKFGQDKRKFKPRPAVIYSGVGILLILLAVFSYYFLLRPAETIDSIAVLPFANTANDLELEYLSDGMTESIINSLSNLSNLNRVIARSSVFQYKGKEIVPQEVGKELGVKAVLISRISQHEDELSISVELVNTENNNRIWGNRYKRAFSEIFEIQDEISESITENLRLELSGEDYQRMTKRYTENSEAYKLYLKGRYFYYKASKEGYIKGLEFFGKAIEIDPDFALAYAGISSCYYKLGWFNFLAKNTAHEKGVEAAMKGLEIDNTVAEIYVALANHKHWYGWKRNIVGALKDYEKALTLNPNDVEAYHEYGHLLTITGKYDEGINMMNRALELEPLSVILNSCMGQTLYEAKKYDQAISQLNKVIEMDPNIMHSYGWLGLSYLQKEMYDEAIEMLKIGTTSSTYSTRCIGILGFTYAVQGKRDSAMAQLKRLTEIANEKVVDPCFIAWIYTGLGETDEAFKWLDKAYVERSNWLIMMNTDQLFDPLRSDARFIKLLKRIGFDT